MAVSNNRSPSIIPQREVSVGSRRGLDCYRRTYKLIVEELCIKKGIDFVEIATDPVVACQLLHGDYSFLFLILIS